jgi:energy-converting hydrogenase A subunit R
LKHIFISDCEGPIARNNIAFELTSQLIPEGDRVYDIINKYDYIHACLTKTREYTWGNTSKLVLPFLLAYDATNKTVEEFSASKLLLMRGSKETLKYVQKISEAFLLSTSYEHYVRALCRELGFPLENTYSPKINLDEYELSVKEKAKLKSLAWEIGGMPTINIPSNAKSLQDLSNRDQATVKRLDKIFWKEIAGTHCKRIFSDVNINGGSEKLNSVIEITNTLSASLSDVMYVGDNVADAEAMKNVKAKDGLSVSLNGDEAAVRNSEVAILSGNSAPITVLADIFFRFGKAEAMNIAGNFDKNALWRTPADPTSLDRLFALYPSNWPKFYIVTDWNVESIVNISNQFRKTVEGEPIAKGG